MKNDNEETMRSTEYDISKVSKKYLKPAYSVYAFTHTERRE